MNIFVLQEPSVVQASAEFQQNAELSSITLQESNSRIDLTKPQSGAPLKLELRHEVAIVGATESSARFSAEIRVTGSRESAEGEEPGGIPAVKISCRLLLEYQLRPGFAPTGDHLNAFSQGNALFHAWPYAREFVQNMAVRMGFPFPPMPLLRLVPKPPDHAENDAPRSAGDDTNK